MFGPCIVAVDYLSGLALYLKKFKMIPVSNCGVKFQYFLSGLERRAIGHTCTFVAFSALLCYSVLLILSTWGEIG